MERPSPRTPQAAISALNSSHSADVGSGTEAKVVHAETRATPLAR